MTMCSRELKATTVDSSLPRDRDEAVDDGNADSLFDYRKWYGREPLIYKPNFSSHYFVHNGWFSRWSRSRRAAMWGHGFDDVIVIRCLGRSPTPIKALLRDVKGFKSTKDSRTTEIYRSSVKADNTQWIRYLVQPSRPLQSISLDEQQKSRLVLDMNEYLDPKTARWYAARGIPYRRGILFHGPPGTGKTSLTFALGGVFNLSIYCVSLNDVGLTEEHLATLFSSLPARCIVLLEDVDTAGLLRDSTGPGPSTASEDSLEKRICRGMVSVAGLLNVIDGAAAKEVRLELLLFLFVTN
jgi:chaperone BCS1